MGSNGSWRRKVGKVRSFIGNSMGGLRGGTNLASWVVAGTLAYFLWVKPSQQLKKDQEVGFSFHFIIIIISQIPFLLSAQINTTTTTTTTI